MGKEIFRGYSWTHKLSWVDTRNTNPLPSDPLFLLIWSPYSAQANGHREKRITICVPDGTIVPGAGT